MTTPRKTHAVLRGFSGGDVAMNDTKDIGQKIKGKAQQVQGEFNQQHGQRIKGGLQKLKGKVNEAVADTKLDQKKPRG